MLSNIQAMGHNNKQDGTPRKCYIYISFNYMAYNYLNIIRFKIYSFLYYNRFEGLVYYIGTVKKVWNNNIKIFNTSLIKDYCDKSGVRLKGLILRHCEFFRNCYISYIFFNCYIKLIKSYPS